MENKNWGDTDFGQEFGCFFLLLGVAIIIYLLHITK